MVFRIQAACYTVIFLIPQENDRALFHLAFSEFAFDSFISKFYASCCTVYFVQSQRDEEGRCEND